MKYHQIFLFAVLSASVTNTWAAPTHVTCVVDNYSDGSPKSFRITFDESDKSWILVNGVRYPDEDKQGIWEIQAFEDVRIEWCQTFSRGKGNEPLHVCYEVNRMTGEFLIANHRKGTTKTGHCTVGRAPEGRKF